MPDKTDFPPLTIITLHSDWIIAAKPAPLLIHPTRPDGEFTFWHALQEHFPREELCLINRLDRETSGLVLVSRNKETSSRLGKMAMNRQIHKRYLVFVQGIPPESGLINRPIARKSDFEHSPIYVLQTVHPKGKEAQTRYRKLETRMFRQQPISLLEVHLLTGRMHQIRVHLQSIGFPVAGDKLYGPSTDFYLRVVKDGWNDDMQDALLLRRQALHASHLEFQWENHPVSVDAPLPGDLSEFWNSCQRLPV